MSANEPKITIESAALSAEPLYSFSVNRNVLLALQLFQSADETRQVLNATKFEISKGLGSPRSLVMVATDGRRLATYDLEIIEDSLLSGELPDVDEFLIDLTGAKKLPKVSGPQGQEVSIAVFAKHVELSCGKYTYRATRVEEKFPNWRQILPTTDFSATSKIGLSLKLLSSFGKAAKLLSEKEIVIFGMRGNESAIEVLVAGDRAFRGILMPCRLETDAEKKEAA